jgi:CheY-like chemotaxis protein
MAITTPLVPERRAPRKTLEPAQTRHALLVEDDDEMRRLLYFVLTRNGFRVTEARDGSEALEWLGSLLVMDRRGKNLDLVVTDQRMPAFSGLDVIEAMRFSGLRAPAILITAFGDAQTHERAGSLGAVEVLDKPFELSRLVSVARRVTRLSREDW